MNYWTTINLVLIFLLLFGLLIYLAICLVFTRAYQHYRVFKINSTRATISSDERQALISFFVQQWELTGYEVVLTKVKFLNIGKSLKKGAHKIIISSQNFISLGYEIDYLLSRLWFSSQYLQKNRQVRVYALITNYLVLFLMIGYCLCFLLQVVFFIVMVVINPTTVHHDFFLFLWKVPLLTIVAFFSGGLMISFIYFLNQLKKVLESNYTHDTLPLVKTNFPTLVDDFKIARQYAGENKIAYNFAFKTKTHHLKWLGPFVKY